ncbi:putative PHD finger protein EHD3 [Cocos nucifera]|nr:putative PHD finger protein EHD3 [Cocos nucifera]
MTTTQLFKIGMAKQDMKQAHDTGLHSSTYEQADHARIDSHWRQVLEHFLQLPDASEGSGIQGCIHDALICGPSGFTRKFKMTNTPWDATQPKDGCKGLNEVKSQSQRRDGAASDVSRTRTSDVNTNTIKCQKVFLDILRSEKFALLCDLLCVTLQDNKGKGFFDFSLINSKMKNWEYEKSPGLFDQDMQQVWDKFQKIGREMVLLASSLSNISWASYQKQVGQDLVNGAGEHKPEASVFALLQETYPVGVEQKNSVESYTVMQLASCESDHSTKPDQTEASGLYKVCTCKKCGTEANGKRSLICDGCEAMYHFSCIEPAIKEIPTRSWYCSACHTNKRESSEPTSVDIHPDSSHQNCAVCDRLEFSETKEENEGGSRTMVADDSRESSVSGMESDESPELSRTAMSRFLVFALLQETYPVGVEQKNSVESYTVMQLASCESDHSTKPDQTEASGLYKVCTCKKCGTEANGKRSLICDGCEAMYHFSCIEPAIKEIPTRSWYCSACHTNKRESSEPTSVDIHPDSSHQNCAVCDRLEFSETKEENEGGSRTMVADDSRESSVSGMESDESPELSRTAMSRLCKLCGTCEDEDKRFLICGHVHCPYKYYHIRCLKTSQIASAQQQNKPCWYCPSCLCRACLCDKDDDKIVLCDGCDEAHHTYCMKPPRTSIPKGQWYCVPCNVARAREGMRRYEQWILQRHGKNDVRQANKANRSMDLLLSAAEKLSSEEQLVAGKKDK